MKLLCINTKIIKSGVFICHGNGLKEGEIYTTKGKSYEDEGGMAYYIEGLGSKLCVRFTELLEEDEAEVMLDNIKREFELN